MGFQGGARPFFSEALSVRHLLVSGQRKAGKKWLHDLFFLLFSQIRDSIVASIPACHAGDQGSIPCHGTFSNLRKTREVRFFDLI